MKLSFYFYYLNTRSIYLVSFLGKELSRVQKCHCFELHSQNKFFTFESLEGESIHRKLPKHCAFPYFPVFLRIYFLMVKFKYTYCCYCTCSGFLLICGKHVTCNCFLSAAFLPLSCFLIVHACDPALFSWYP